MSEPRKDVKYTFLQDQNIPIYTNEEIVDDSQENEIDVVNLPGEDVDIETYGEEEEDIDHRFYDEMVEQAPALKKGRRESHFCKKLEKIAEIAHNVASEKVDLVHLGTSIMKGASNKTLNGSSVDKAVKEGIASSSSIGGISIESLIKEMYSSPDAADGRYAMLGTSVMWNALKSNMRDLKSNITEKTSTVQTEPRFDAVDLNVENIAEAEGNYEIISNGLFMNENLLYIFKKLPFRSSAKLLNKTKQFLKEYFIIACRPRCMIWRYTLRRSGNSNKRAILNLPDIIVQNIITLLMDLTGIGNGEKTFEELDPRSPLYHSLGDNESLREQRYYETCKLKDPLMYFFRGAITDTLNEVREMPYCLSTGVFKKPLRGREKNQTCVMWKDYEAVLKTEQDVPSEVNIKKRIKFEKHLCEIPNLIGRR